VDVLFAMAYHLSRIATHDGEWSNISRYHYACSNDRASPDPAALKHARSLAHLGPILYHREVDRGKPVSYHGLTEIVGRAVLLKEHAVWTGKARVETVWDCWDEGSA
jgi:hypothetical protein